LSIMTDFTAIISNYVEIDPTIFQDWINGLSVNDCIAARIRALTHVGDRKPAGANPESVKDDSLWGLRKIALTSSISRASSQISQTCPSAKPSPMGSSNSIGLLSSSSRGSIPFGGNSISESSLPIGIVPGQQRKGITGSSALRSGREDLPRRGSVLTEFKRAMGSVVDSIAGNRITAATIPGSNQSYQNCATDHLVEDTLKTAQPAAIHMHVVTQWRVFEMTEGYLHRPRHFMTQAVVPLHSKVRRAIIERYYSFDDTVMRELLGKKLTSRTRRELDEQGSNLQVSISSARRQFDNLKRIMKRAEDAPDILGVILDEFVLPPRLAQYV
jgi:hypothetical protein